MKIKSKHKSIKWVAGALIVFVLLGAWGPSVQAEKICEKAFSRCLLDAVISLILSGPQTSAIYASGCLNGYIWCLNYYVDFEQK